MFCLICVIEYGVTHTHTHTLTHTPQDLIPISVEMEIPFEFHRYIIGQKGREVRSLMDEHDVNILVPSPDKKVRNGEREGARGREKERDC